MIYIQALVVLIIVYLAHRHLLAMLDRREKSDDIVKDRMGPQYFMIPDHIRPMLMNIAIATHMMVWPFLLWLLYEGGFFK